MINRSVQSASIVEKNTQINKLKKHIAVLQSFSQNVSTYCDETVMG